MSLVEQIDEDTYKELHRNLIHQPTRRETEKQQATTSNSNQLRMCQT